MQDNDGRIRWKCRRGMLELDVILERFFDSCYSDLNEQQRTMFDKLLDESDAQLYRWFLNYETPEDKEVADMVKWVASFR